MIDYIQAWLLLSRTKGLGIVKIQALLSHFDSVEEIFSNSNSLQQINLPTPIKQALNNPDLSAIKADLLWLEQPNNHILAIDNDLFPPLLKQTDSPPPLLYITGDPHVLLQPQLAVVGSRSATPLGLKNTQSFCYDLAKGGLVITSGMALGIDGAAHKAAISSGGKTIAIMGTGLDSVYPAKHRELAHEIANNGALVSEFPTGTRPHAHNFPRRNRIICGLALGTLVVEAGIQSGTLITARQTMEINRPVMAIPGSIHSPLAKGCHSLIKQGAKLIESAQEIMEELTPLAQSLSLQIKAKLASIESVPQTINVTKIQQKVLQHIMYEATSIDDIINNSKLSTQEISAILLELELEDKIKALPGAQYLRL
ncbi:MAG: DNA-processing protein DprA [Proteobacteria bacterium]|nr:DNA-processing protein DprA [Pseudomonadota bacterium]